MQALSYGFPLRLKECRISFLAQAVFKRLARILASKVTMQNDSFCIPDVQARILYRFHCQFRCHRCAIGIADDFTAAQIHDRRQISPSFFLHMDAGNICAPFLIDGFCSKITFQDIHFIIWDTAVIGMAAIFLCNDGIALNLSFKYSKSCCAIGVNI